MRNINRGDIYYVAASYSIGSEQRAGRPAVIVSNDRNNRSSNTVEVVYFTTKDKPDLPTHVTIYATGTPSTALCEQVHTVDKQRLGNFCGTCTKQELQAVDIALLISLGLDFGESRERVEETTTEEVTETFEEYEETEESKEDTEGAAGTVELIETRAKLDMMQELYRDLLDKTVGVAVK